MVPGLRFRFLGSIYVGPMFPRCLTFGSFGVGLTVPGSIAGDSRCPGFQARARGPVGARLVGLVFPGLVFPLTPVLFGLWGPDT